MATPPRMVELECPKCHHRHWEIDHDFRGAWLFGQPELSYDERTYECPACGGASTGYSVHEKSPPEFFLQPHPMYPMTTRDFARWLAVFRDQFPSDERLRSVGVLWYPGEAGDEQREKLLEARHIGTAQQYRLSLSNRSPDDERIRVCVQGKGEATFSCGSQVELEQCFFGFDGPEIETIRGLLAARASEIRLAWERFSRAAKAAQDRWVPELLAEMQKLPPQERPSGGGSL